MIIYDLTPAEWASGSVTMRFLVENYPYKVIPTFSEGPTMFGRYVGYISYSRYKIEKFKTGSYLRKSGEDHFIGVVFDEESHGDVP